MSEQITVAAVSKVLRAAGWPKATKTGFDFGFILSKGNWGVWAVLVEIEMRTHGTLGITVNGPKGSKHYATDAFAIAGIAQCLIDSGQFDVGIVRLSSFNVSVCVDVKGSGLASKVGTLITLDELVATEKRKIRDARLESLKNVLPGLQVCKAILDGQIRSLTLLRDYEQGTSIMSDADYEESVASLQRFFSDHWRLDREMESIAEVAKKRLAEIPK